MKKFKQYSNMALFSALFMMTFIMGGCGGSSSCEDIDRPTIAVGAPFIISTIPVNNAVNVPLDQIISATLNEAFNPDTVNTDTFKVFNGPLQVPGSVTHDLANNKMIFTPDANLSANVVYTATVTTGVTDVAGNALESDYIWNFTTGTTISATPPIVILTDPENNDIDVPINRTISALISEELNENTVTNATFTLSSVNGPVSGEVYYFNKTMFFNPDGNLTADTNYTATVTTGIQDLDGQSMVEDYVWRFTTGDENTTAPYVVSTNPEANATDVGLNKTISALLNEAADPSTVNTDTFTVFNGSTQVTGTVTYLSKRMFFKPTSPLDPDTEYTATVTTGVTDLDDNNLDDSNGRNIWNFTTGTLASEGPDPVNLGTAEDFAILTKSGISTTGNTFITGDIGVSPATLTAITGFAPILDSTNTFATSTLVDGKIYAAAMAAPTPAKMTTAVSDMETAYTDAAGRTNPDATELGAGNISGMTIVPGLYKWGTGVLITGAGVTLSGGVNDVWIFQISGDLTVESDAIVTLEGGAQAKNIFWQVAGGNGVKLGTGSDFKGVVLAQTKIVLDTGATVVEGRLLAQTAVTLDANTITEPTE